MEKYIPHPKILGEFLPGDMYIAANIQDVSLSGDVIIKDKKEYRRSKSAAERFLVAAAEVINGKFPWMVYIYVPQVHLAPEVRKILGQTSLKIHDDSGEHDVNLWKHDHFDIKGLLKERGPRDVLLFSSVWEDGRRLSSLSHIFESPVLHPESSLAKVYLRELLSRE